MTEQEMRRQAEQNVNCTLAFFMMAFPSLNTAIDKISKERWNAAIDERVDEVQTWIERLKPLG